MPDSYDTPVSYWTPEKVGVPVGRRVRAKVLGWDSNVFEVGVEIPENPVVEGIYETHWIERGGCWDFLVNGESIDPATIEYAPPGLDEWLDRSDLPSLRHLSAAERRYLAMRLQRLRDLTGMAMGAYAESVVAEALPGAVEARSVVNPVDLRWRPVGSRRFITLQVKFTRGMAWNVNQRVTLEGGTRTTGHAAEVYVLAAHRGWDNRRAWSFYVVPRWRLDGWQTNQVSVRWLSTLSIDAVRIGGLPDAVKHAVNKPRGWRRMVNADLLHRRRPRTY